MSFSITLAWWHIPAVVTVLAVLWTLFWPADTSGSFGGIARLFMALPALIVSLLAWAIAGFFK
jgi:hypothetical protein